jgi:hypothetical protein
MARGSDSNELRADIAARTATGEQPVPLAYQQISRVEGHRHAVCDMKRVPPVAPVIRVLDVVVHKRRLVKALDRDSRSLY